MKYAIRCRNCQTEIDIENLKNFIITKEKEEKKTRFKNNSFRFRCPQCGLINHVKCRYNGKTGGGKIKSVKILH